MCNGIADLSEFERRKLQAFSERSAAQRELLLFHTLSRIEGKLARADKDKWELDAESVDDIKLFTRNIVHDPRLSHYRISADKVADKYMRTSTRISAADAKQPLVLQKITKEIAKWITQYKSNVKKRVGGKYSRYNLRDAYLPEFAKHVFVLKSNNDIKFDHLARAAILVRFRTPLCFRCRSLLNCSQKHLEIISYHIRSECFVTSIKDLISGKLSTMNCKNTTQKNLSIAACMFLRIRYRGLFIRIHAHSFCHFLQSVRPTSKRGQRALHRKCKLAEYVEYGHFVSTFVSTTCSSE
jgi:hypothetical protein